MVFLFGGADSRHRSATVSSLRSPGSIQLAISNVRQPTYVPKSVSWLTAPVSYRSHQSRNMRTHNCTTKLASSNEWGWHGKLCYRRPPVAGSTWPRQYPLCIAWVSTKYLTPHPPTKSYANVSENRKHVVRKVGNMCTMAIARHLPEYDHKTTGLVAGYLKTLNNSTKHNLEVTKPHVWTKAYAIVWKT